MQKISLFQNPRTIFVPLFILVLLFLYIVFFTNNSIKNLLNNNTINQGVGWKNNQSLYSGSELSFSFSKSKDISFTLNTNSKADQGVEILIDDTSYIISSPNINAQKLTITVDKNKPHAVTIRHFCTFFYNPCQIILKGIYLDSGAQITPYRRHNKIISILGDSISTIYGKNNYSQILADDLGYELHNASIMGSTVSEVPNVDNAINRYKKDMTNFKSDIIISFLGTNDASKNVPLDKFEKDYSKIVSDIKSFNPNSKIFLVGILQRKDINYDILQRYSNAIKIVAEKYNVYFIDPYNWLNENDFSDDIHPSLNSQEKLAIHFKNILSSSIK